MPKTKLLMPALGHQFEEGLVCKYCQKEWVSQKRDPSECKCSVLDNSKENRKKVSRQWKIVEKIREESGCTITPMQKQISTR